MNIMLVSVTERTKEIGIRKAVGATKFNTCRSSDRSGSVTAIGGLAGLVVGEIASLLMNRYSPLLPMCRLGLAMGIEFRLRSASCLDSGRRGKRRAWIQSGVKVGMINFRTGLGL